MSDLVAYNHELAELRSTVAQLDTVDEAKDLADRAAAAQTWARRAKLGMEAVNRAAEVKLRAERRAGEMLAAEPELGRGKKTVTLTDFGVDENESRRFQELASIPEREFEKSLAEEKAEGPLTRNGVIRRAMHVHYSSATDLWATPQDLFDELDSEFGFTLDVCAVPENAKCAAFFTEQQDGLAQEWRGTCWMNPPYGDAIGQWVEKAYESGKAGATVVCLVPARVDTGWWWRWCRYGEVRFLRGRLKFGGGENSAPFPSALVIFGRPANILEAHWERAA